MCVSREWFHPSLSHHLLDLPLLVYICVVVLVNSVVTNARRDVGVLYFVMDRRRKGDGSVVTWGLSSS